MKIQKKMEPKYTSLLCAYLPVLLLLQDIGRNNFGNDSTKYTSVTMPVLIRFAVKQKPLR